MIVKTSRLALLCAVVAVIVYLIPASLTAMAAGAPASDRGQRLYRQYCASCHGVDGKGGGPVALKLKTAPADLTTIPKEHGKFPGVRIKLVIAGEVGETELMVHGAREMPVWGRVFRFKRADKSAAAIDVFALVKYIESIQSN
jgi:mono/diheme cytochrome c family protein